MDASLTQKKAIALGEVLVRELGKYPDVLSQWMAHYIGEQMALAATTTGEAKTQVEARCFQTILALWSHRAKLPNGFRPFDGFEPILTTLARLDPDNARGFYRNFRVPQEKEASTDKRKESVDRWMEFAEATDYVARLLIDLAVRTAAKLATSDSTEAIIEAASADDKDVTILRRLQQHGGAADAVVESAKSRVEELERHIARLKWLKSRAEAAEADLNRALVIAKELTEKSAHHESVKPSPTPKDAQR